MVFYNYIEIGTSDFDTEIQKENNNYGISIEPIKYYYDKLPNKENSIKLNMAISNYIGKCHVYYLSEDTIKKYNFPDYIRGCNCINKYHPEVVITCNNRNIDINTIYEKQEVDVTTVYQIMINNNIDGVYYLKIDTEGHDTVILKHFYEENKNKLFLPHIIRFESNHLTDNNLIIDTIILYSNIGYDFISRTIDDVVLKLNLTKIKNKTTFTTGLKNYYINDHPPNYDLNNLPHENTLESAKEYCIKNNYSGVTYQYNIYQARIGTYLIHYENTENIDLCTWVYI
jgi:FkbM family methyltransferase